MKRQQKKAFTLVELLVVIAILAILASVAVVGYTSFMKNAAVSNDQALVTQLNHYLDALKADSTSNLPKDIDNANAWAIIQRIVNESGIGKIEPDALKYGYHIYFNTDTDKFELDNLKKEGNTWVSGLRVLINTPVRANGNEKPGVFTTVDKNYFLADTKGSDLAKAVRGFYTFDFLREDDEISDPWEAFKKIVETVNSEGHVNIQSALNDSVFVTPEGSKFIESEGKAYTPVFHVDEEGVVMSANTPKIKLETDENNEVISITFPKNVTQIEDGALPEDAFEIVKTKPEDETRGNPIKFESSAEEIKSVVTPDFPHTFEDGDGKNCKVEGVDIQDATTGEKITQLADLKYLTDFDIKVSGTENKVYNSFAEDEFTYDENGEKIGIKTNNINSAYVVWDGASFTLELDETDYEYYFSASERKTLSSKKINWELVGEYEGVTLENNVIKLSINEETGLYPEIDSITVKGTVAHVPDGVTPATHNFTIYLPRIDAATFMFGGNTVTNNAVDVFWGISADDSYKNSYEVKLTGATSSSGVESLKYDDSIMNISTTWAAENTEQNGNTFTFNNVFSEITDENHEITDTDRAKTITMTVNVGGYKKFDFTVNVNHAQFMFEAVKGGLKYVGSEGATITFSDLFKQVNTDATYNNVKLHAYIVPQNGQSQSIYNLETNYKLQTENNADAGLDGVYASAQVIDTNGTIDFDLINPDIPVNVMLVVTVDGVRASENYTLTVVGGTNVRLYSDLVGLLDTTATDINGILTYPLNNSVVLLNDIAMDSTRDYFTIPAGKTFYGNTFDFNIKAGRRSEEGIIYLSGRLQDTRVLGAVYASFAGTVGDDCGSSAIMVNGANAHIYNCYISNTRSPIRVGSSVIIEDSVLFGGRYANVDIVAGTVTIRGDVTTIQQKYTPTAPTTNENGVSDVIGIGVSAWFTDRTYNVVVEDTANFKQYNFMDESLASSLPALSYSGIELVKIADVFTAMFGNDYADYHFSSNDKTYVHAGVNVLDKYSLNYTVTETALEGRCAGYYQLTITLSGVSDTDEFVIVGPSGEYKYYPGGVVSQSAASEDFTGSLTVTGAQLKAGVVLSTAEKKTSITAGSMTYDFLITSDKYRALSVSGLSNYDNVAYTYDMGTAFGLASSLLSTFHSKGIHYNKMIVDVYTADKDNAAYKTMLEEYIAAVSSNYYTPENYYFNSQGTLDAFELED